MPKPRFLVLGLVVVVAVVALTDASPGRTIVATIVGMLLLKAGFAMLGGVIMPLPEPPPPGELRKVKVEFRCSLCGTEARVTIANDQMPEAPKHCMEEMDLVTPVDDL